MKWTYLDPATVDKSIFGYKRSIYTVRVAKYHGKFDVRSFRLKGCDLFADLLNYNPVTGKSLKQSVFFIFAAKGE